MMKRLQTQEASELIESLSPTAKEVCHLIDIFSHQEATKTLNCIQTEVDKLRSKSTADDDFFLNDLFVIDKYVGFLFAYNELWSSIVDEKFSESWVILQDALDHLRLIKRFSSLDVAFFEMQLIELERLYPYKLFASVGMLVSHFECSLCGHDIDSMDCPHIRGQLYRGQIAFGIAKDIVAFDHVALVENPENKRCVLTIDNSSEQFNLFRYFSELLRTGNSSPLRFVRCEFTTRKVNNPKYVQLKRNEPCFCGSGKKFKKCCLGKHEIEHTHVNIVTSS